ncbi:hypothetical protein [Halorubellus salinus]|uniref:hypothetical protein n=1 Tax=Halorubellus salinus TaxID=755309 RepID=UPI001D069592|nr:hypothetical protein [Halorubellus salinus]
MDTAREASDLLDDRPDLEPALEAVLDADAPWTFDDVDVDSGEFGELVSRGLVEEVDDGYRVVDPASIERALDGEIEDRPGLGDAGVEISWPTVGRLELAGLAGALLFVVALRLVSYPAVFQGDAVVLSANDPYYYRYWLEQLLTNPETTLETLPLTVSTGEPLMLGVLWATTLAFGGTTAVAGQVLAWFPVVSALVTAGIVYAAARSVTEDRRIALASVLMLAVSPAHAFRTSLGFADHHAFDYPWLALTLLGAILVLSWVRSSADSNATVVGGVVAITVGVAAQTLAWEAGPLLIVALGLTIATVTVTRVARGESVLAAAGPMVLGVLLATACTWVVHTELGWHTTLVVSAPLLLGVASLGVLATGVLWNRTDLHVAGLVVVDFVGAAVGAFAFRSLRPDLWERMTTQVTERLLATENIAEFQSLFGDAAGWLLLFGFLLLLALPYMAWASTRLLDDARWTPLVVYGWYFLVLGAISVRFAGQLSIVVAVFAALGFVHLAEWIDVANQPAPFSNEVVDSLQLPDRRQAFALVGLFLLVTALSIVQVPVKTSQITQTNDGYETAAWMASHSESEGLEYPENYVLSQWGHNRMYNYFVNGEARSYGYARSNYADFVTSTNGTAWYERLRDRVGFVVTTRDVLTNESTLGTRLHRHNGSRTDSSPGVGHYRLLHVEQDGAYKVFTLVPGAEVRGRADPGSTVTVRTTVSLDSHSFEYVREATADANGTYSIHVPYAGTYSVAGQSVTVPAEAVTEGATIRAGESSQNATHHRSQHPSAAGPSASSPSSADGSPSDRFPVEDVLERTIV